MKFRQACAIESAARTNPDWQIWVTFSSQVGFDRNSSKNSPILMALKSLPNIKWRNVNLWSYTRGTPAENWMRKGELFKSMFLSEHTADLLRLIRFIKWN